MPVYTFICEKCNNIFEIVSSIRSYSNKQKCNKCLSEKHVIRYYIEDISSLCASIKKSDSELKTVGDIANRNRDKMSEDQKQALYEKHNDYKDKSPEKPLPKGASRMKKQPKTKWT